MRGLIVGRFQPFHKGHLEAIKFILSECDDLIVIIAASQQSHLPANPFTAGERYDMIHQSLVDELSDITRVIIVPANDIKDNGLWVAHILRLVPKFDIVYSNNPLIRYLFAQGGKETRQTPLFERKEYSAAHIRKLIWEGNDGWKKLVPKSVVKIIEEIDGVKRLQIINATDEHQEKS